MHSKDLNAVSRMNRKHFSRNTPRVAALSASQSFGKNAQGKPYPSKEAALQAMEDKRKKEGQKKRRKPNSN
eukprot:590673-Pelagomonas_calceolata.AAC.1